MKNSFVLCMALFMGGILLGQKKDSKRVTVKERTLMGQFEPSLVVPAEKRLVMKEERIAYQKKTKEILDTLDISTRKRKRLIKELKRSPFSENIKKTIVAETQFEDAALPTHTKE